MSQTPGVADHGAPVTVAADARNRALRTLVQQLGIDLLAAIALVVYTGLAAETVDWRLLGLSILKTALSTAASYAMRYVAPPPAPEG